MERSRSISTRPDPRQRQRGRDGWARVCLAIRLSLNPSPTDTGCRDRTTGTNEQSSHPCRCCVFHPKHHRFKSRSRTAVRRWLVRDVQQSAKQPVADEGAGDCSQRGATPRINGISNNSSPVMGFCLGYRRRGVVGWSFGL